MNEDIGYELSIVFFTALFAVLLGVMLAPFIISYLRKLKMGQVIRAEGPKGHQSKAGTPTMGGVIFILPALASLFLSPILLKRFFDIDVQNKNLLLLIYPFILYGLIGFIDDYLIVVKKHNEGLKPKMKFLLQLLIGVGFFFLYLQSDLSTSINFFGLFELNLVGFYGLLTLFIMVGTSNAVNLTDGLDGLAGGTSAIAFISLMFIALFKQEYEIAMFCSAMIGGLFAFLTFNIKPAKVMMGDTGSLALGAAIATVAIMLKVELLLIIIGGVFVLETLSVMLQVFYFKRTGGKRLFKMSPLHHHFELSGWSETGVVNLFWGVGLILGVIGLLLANLFV